jgi:arylformamidase
MQASTRTPGRIIDLSHTIHSGMVTYPGLPGPEISDFLSRAASAANYAEGATFQIGQITMVANTGTYLDSPFHRYADGADLSQLDLECLADLPGLVVRSAAAGASPKPAAPPRAITAAELSGVEVRGKAVLLATDWDLHWQTERYAAADHPYLAADGAQALVDGGAGLVGIDSINIDDRADLARPAHTILLRAGIPIVEHLCGLRELPAKDFRFFAVPPKVRGFGTFPVRAFAIL